MIRLMSLFVLTTLFLLNACGGGGSTNISQSTMDTAQYITKLSQENGINYEKIINTVAYIPPTCWTNTYPDKSTPCFQCHQKPGHDAEKLVAYYNPCYSCHTVGKEPNYLDDSSLQIVYAFPNGFTKNPWTNLFKDKTQAVMNITDDDIIRYIRQDNYIDNDSEIILKKNLPSDWLGYRPDCYFNFDTEGFDIDPKTKQYTGWRAFRYYPFPGGFMPTNGSFDDVLIRLPEEFRTDKDGKFNKEIYKANLSILEALIKQRDITIESIDERLINHDLDKDGILGIATKVKFTWKTNPTSMTYVGKAEELLKQGKLRLAGGLYPVGTEFLHTVRYIDWDDAKNEPKMSKRMKELRYAKKTWWANYNFLEEFFNRKGREIFLFGEVIPEFFVGNYKTGFETGNGWIYQGYIEDKRGNLRPQTNEETVFCMGCHSYIGASTDTTFAFARKLEGSSQADIHYGWGHWSQKGLKGIKEPIVEYQVKDLLGRPLGKLNEYAFYLRWTKSADDYRMNEEVMSEFFDSLGFRKRDKLALLRDDISVLLYPSRQRAMLLNKAYWSIVKEQSFTKGRDATVKPATSLNVFEDIENNLLTAVPYKTY
ncbi:MAG: hypothetical protein N3A62_06505 [Thermodesulfovibrionales bacterium]|nr:hypothetical protein [Thermodesulfovibrionales bacterium]